jgi:hypothetical protein
VVEITAEIVRNLLSYDPETGWLIWRSTRSRGAKAGQRAGGIHHAGHRKLMLFGKSYLEHRLAFLWMTGQWPEHQIDHINQDKADNRWSNLREATHGQNSANRSISRTKNHGLPRGVSPQRGTRRFTAQIKQGGKIKHLGAYPTPEEAHTAYLRAAREAFGEFLPRELQHAPDT